MPHDSEEEKEFLSDVDDVIEESHDVPHDSEEEKEEPQGKGAEETSGETQSGTS